MKHNIFCILFLFIIGVSASASCENEKLAIKVYISDQTLEVAYNNGAAFLSGVDHVEVIEKSLGRVHVFKHATLQDDQAGQFKIVAPSSLNTQINFIHDHESSPFEGLFGNFIGEKGVYDLSGLKCEWDELFHVL